MIAFLKKREELLKRFDAVKAKGFRRALAEDGAVDLASIMVGILVLGIVAGIIVATVFGVIPWSQDNAASQSLDGAKTAESVYYAETLSGGTGGYATAAVLTAPIAANNNTPLLQASKKLAIVVNPSGVYYAVSRSDTGKFFYITSTDPNTVQSAANLTALNTAIGTLAVSGYTFNWTDATTGLTSAVATS